MKYRTRAVVVALVTFLLPLPASAYGDDATCGRGVCPSVDIAPGALTAAYATQTAGNQWVASNEAPTAHPYTYRLLRPCQADAAAGGLCRPDDDAVCESPPGRVVQLSVVERQRLVLPDGSTVDGFDAAGNLPGASVGPWLSVTRACIDITALNPPPSPGEVYRYFQTLPLPDLPTQQQPPGNALAGLPVVFYTDGPTTQTFTVNV